MTKDSPSGGGRASSKKPGSPVPAAAVLEEQRRELEKLRADLERERARGRAERRHFAAQARQLREAAERDRQQLADHLRSKWEAQSSRELRQLQEVMLREREAEIRRLLRWKEAELRQLQRLLHRERDCVVRQARELQRQLAEELVSRGYCGRTGAPEGGAAQCRCRLQEVLAQLRWDQDGEQASRIRHLQEALDVERHFFLKYILEHFRWQPPLPESQPLPALPPLGEQPPETADGSGGPAEPVYHVESLRSLSSGVCRRSRSLDLVPLAGSSPPDGLLPTRPSSLDSLTPVRSLSLHSTLCAIKTPESNEGPDSTSPIASILGSPSPSPPPASGRPSAPGGEDDDSGSQSCETLTPSPKGQDYRQLAKQNSELSEALQVLAHRCSGLRAENQQLRRAGLPREAHEKVKRLKVKHAELTGLARRLEDRARKLQETNLRALSAPGLGERDTGLELCQALGSQRARHLSEQASVLLAKDKQIEELRRECHLLQARVASGLGDSGHADGGAAQAQWLSINDLDRLHRESQREVLRLQKQLTLQRGTSRARAGDSGRSGPSEEAARSQIEALEGELGALRRECADLSAQAAAERLRGEEAEAQLRAAQHKGAWLARENARLQTQADWMSRVADENKDVRGQLDRACRERDAADLLAQQLLQQATREQDRQQQLQRDLQKALRDLQAAREEMQALQHQPALQSGDPQETPQGLASQGKKNGSTEFLPKPGDPGIVGPSRNRQKKDPSQMENPVALGEPASVPPTPNRVPANHPPESRPQAKKISSLSNFSSEVESTWTGVLSCLDVDMANEVDDLEPDNVSSALEMEKSEASDTPKFKIFLARYSYNPLEGPNEHPESELPFTAGDYVYIFGDMDEDGFYEGELEDGRRGLVPSNLVEQITDGDDLGELPSEVLHLPTGEGKGWKEDPGHSSFLGHEVLNSCQEPQLIDGPEVREPEELVKAASKTEGATELLGAKAAADHLDLVHEMEEQGLSRRFLGAPGSLCVGPMQLHLQSLAATSAEITWVYSSSNHPHTVYLNDQEYSLTPAGVSHCTFHHLNPGMRYQVRVEVQPLWDSLQGPSEMLSPTITFTTPLAGPPDPPLDVLVEPHAFPGRLVVSWLPVTINSMGSSNGVQVTGYAVYADGLKVTEVADATAGSIVLELSQLQRPLLCQKVSVRTMSLSGESLDSVPALVPLDDSIGAQSLDPSPFTYTSGDLSADRDAFSNCSQRQAQSAKTSPQPPGNCAESGAKDQEVLLEEPLRRHCPKSSLDSEGKLPCIGSSHQTPRTTEAYEASKEDKSWQKYFQNHRPAWPSGCPGGKEDHNGLLATHTQPAAGVKQPVEGGPCKEPYQDQAAPEKSLRPKQADPQSIPPRHTSPVCETWGVWQKEAVPFGLRGTERQKLRKRRRTQTLGCRREWQLCQPSPTPHSAPSRKILGRSSGRKPLMDSGADPATSVFVALIDHDPLVTAGDPKTDGKEAAFQKGQLLKAWGSQDPYGFYCGEYSGQMGNIPGHLQAEVEIQERLAGQWLLPASGHQPSVTTLDDFELLPSSQGSFRLPPEDPRKSPLWTPKTMMAALDYDPKDGSARGQWKGKLSLRAGDMVTVYGPVDDDGFYYGESGSRKGLVPAYLLDHVSLHGE
ncbi:RIMS-binding protein 3C-like [Sorex fumeus]|uniref:RIMS-binding protein 3C-like n=1 Tax=Sorex fumeus TaxID=62283 RepID=UPI0024AE7705|nr:RIMS-binding protein 3C-like [Sorex fumeus]